METRIEVGRERKIALARAAASAIRPREFLFLDSGSTNLALAALLPEDQELTVATNSVDIAAAVLRRQDLKLILIGGPVDPLVGGCVDGAAVQSVEQLNIDRCFIGTCSFSPITGVSAFHSSDATFKRALISVSEHCATLVTTDKFEVRAPHRVAPIAQIETLVIEHDVPTHILKQLALAGVSMLKAEPG
jgi:DeoR/GlpR family transcriptional regulator of sugar metabolism